MAERKVLRMGDPRLREVAAPVTEFGTPALHALVADLWETMAVYEGLGLAATQIGEPWRVVVFGLEPDADGDERRLDIPRTVLVNPEIEPVGEVREDGWEGCLSLPGMRGVVPRHRRIVYRGFDQLGTALEREVSGYHARVVQHECDHLDGILYPMRMTDMSRFGFAHELDEALLEGACA